MMALEDQIHTGQTDGKSLNGDNLQQMTDLKVIEGLCYKTIIEENIFGLVRMYVTPYRFSWTIFILGFAQSYTDKLLIFRWVQIVLFL